MIPLHWESPAQSEYRELHVLSTQLHVEGHAVEEQSTSAAEATAKVVAKTVFMMKVVGVDVTETQLQAAEPAYKSKSLGPSKTPTQSHISVIKLQTVMQQ
jgi:hypothetical protein